MTSNQSYKRCPLVSDFIFIMNDSSSGSEDYDESLIRIGAGTFATVYVIPQVGVLHT
jgi:hypothetical protein